MRAPSTPTMDMKQYFAVSALVFIIMRYIHKGMLYFSVVVVVEVITRRSVIYCIFYAKINETNILRMLTGISMQTRRK